MSTRSAPPSLASRLLLAATLLLALTGTAVAESARAHFERGTSAYAAGRYDDAAKEYEAAYRLKPDPALLYNAAQAYRLGGDKPRALELYQSCLRLYASRMPNVAEVKRHVSELEEAIANEQHAAAPPPVAPPPTPPPPPPAPPPTVVTQPPPPPERPLVKRPLFWVAVAGAVVVVAAVGVGVGVAAGGPEDPTATFGVVRY